MKENLRLQPGNMSTYKFTVRSESGSFHIKTKAPAQVRFFFSVYGGEESMYFEYLYLERETIEPMENMPRNELMRISSSEEIEEIYMNWDYVGLITPDELSKLTRMSYVDDDKARCFIDEAEQNDIRSKLGDDLYNYVVEHFGELPDLMNGSSYDTQCGMTRYHAGLKKALAYYAYSRLIVGGNIELTRSGMVNRDSDYSHHSDNEERQQTSRETAAIADRYLNEVLDYVRNDETLKQYAPKPTPFKNTSRTNVTIIGD